MITFVRVNIEADQMVLNYPVSASLEGSQAAVSLLCSVH